MPWLDEQSIRPELEGVEFEGKDVGPRMSRPTRWIPSRRLRALAGGAAALTHPLVHFGETATDDEDVWRLVVERTWAGSQPGQRADGARVALAIEGGGMTGAVSAGMCVALESLGLIGSFDVIYGSSSGALNASYTAAGQARGRAGLYPRAADARLIDPRRALRGRPPFRLSEIINSLLCAHPHDERVLHGRPPLRVTATRVKDKGLDVLSDFLGVREVRQAVWASCAIPILAGDVVEFRGERYVDGGLIESLPYGVALREGATHVLVLRARPASYRFRGYSRATLRGIDRLLRDAPDTLSQLIRERPERYNVEARALQSRPTELAGCVCQLAPPDDVRVTSQFEARPHRLVEAIRLGVQTTYHTLAPFLTPVQANGHNGRSEAAAHARAA
jgi:predicted patatin/cPLA2 family phospholipase